MSEQETYRKKAVALGYEADTDVAPKIKAAGRGYVAEEIIQRAKEMDLPIQEDSSLVELLSEITINETIPEDLYQVVAEVFAYIYQVDQEVSSK